MLVIQVVGGARMQSNQPVVTIGSDSGSQIAFLDDPRVEPRHAVIRQVAGRWLIESQGSGLLQIGNGVPTQTAWLTPGDCIKLAGNGPEIIFSPADPGVPWSAAIPPSTPMQRPGSLAPKPADFAQPAAMPRPEIRSERPSVRPSPELQAPVPSCDRPSELTSRARPWNHPAIWALGGAALLAAGILLGGRGNANIPQGTPGDRLALQQSDLPHNNVTESTASRSIEPEHQTALPSATATPAGAIYLIISEMPLERVRSQAGIGFCLDAHHLVTSGGVAREIKLQQQRKLNVVARSPASGGDLKIGAIHEHPEFKKAADEIAELQPELNMRYDELDRLKEAGNLAGAADIATLADQIASREEQLSDSYLRHAVFDVAIVEVAENLPQSLSVSPAPEKLAPGMSLVLWGDPIAPHEFAVDPEKEIRPSQVPVKLLLLQQIEFEHSPPQRILRIKGNLSDRNWAGSPVVESGGKVVGIYSRQLIPPAAKSDRPAPTPQAKDVHYAVDIERLNELLRTLPPLK